MIYLIDLTLDKAETNPNEFAEMLDILRAYPARGPKYTDLKKSVFKNAKNYYDGWKKTVYGFKNGILPFHLDKNMHTDNIKDKNGLINYEELDRPISLKK